MDTKNTCAQTLLTILGSRINIIGRILNAHLTKDKVNLHFDNERDIHMSSKNDDENGYGQDLDFLIISYQLSLSYCTSSGLCRAKSVRRRTSFYPTIEYKHPFTNNMSDSIPPMVVCNKLWYTFHHGKDS